MIQKWCAAWLFCFSVAYTQPQTTDYTVSVAQRQTRWQTDLQYLISGLSATGDTVDEYGRRTRGQKDFVKLLSSGFIQRRCRGPQTRYSQYL